MFAFIFLSIFFESVLALSPHFAPTPVLVFVHIHLNNYISIIYYSIPKTQCNVVRVCTRCFVILTTTNGVQMEKEEVLQDSKSKLCLGK